MYTLEEVVASAQKAVTEKGTDYVYDNSDCVYSTVDESEYFVPSCLVGWVLNDLDHILFREIADSKHNAYPLQLLLESGAMPTEWATKEAFLFLKVVQKEQDTGLVTWERCINQAIKTTKESFNNQEEGK